MTSLLGWATPTGKAYELNYDSLAVKTAQTAPVTIYDFLADRLPEDYIDRIHGSSLHGIKFLVLDSDLVVDYIHEFMASHNFYPHSEPQIRVANPIPHRPLPHPQILKSVISFFKDQTGDS